MNRRDVPMRVPQAITQDILEAADRAVHEAFPYAQRAKYPSPPNEPRLLHGRGAVMLDRVDRRGYVIGAVRSLGIHIEVARGGAVVLAYVEVRTRNKGQLTLASRAYPAPDVPTPDDLRALAAEAADNLRSLPAAEA